MRWSRGEGTPTQAEAFIEGARAPSHIITLKSKECRLMSKASLAAWGVSYGVMATVFGVQHVAVVLRHASTNPRAIARNKKILQYDVCAECLAHSR